MKFFESDVPQGNGRCSDNACPCPEVEIKRGAGYLYVDQELVDFRKQYPSLESAREAMRQKQAQISSDQGGAVQFFYRLGPILVCEKGANLRKLDLQAAAADAIHWWNTGLVPLRATPKTADSHSENEIKTEQPNVVDTPATVKFGMAEQKSVEEKPLTAFQNENGKAPNEVKRVRASGDSIDEVKAKVKEQVSEGMSVISEKVLSDGSPQVIEAIGESLDDAFQNALTKKPDGADVTQKRCIEEPQLKTVTLEAFDEIIARELGQACVSGQKGKVLKVSMKIPGRNGFLGIGKKPHVFEVEVCYPAKAEITVKPKVVIEAIIVSGRLKEIRESYNSIYNYAHASGTAALFKNARQQAQGQDPVVAEFSAFLNFSGQISQTATALARKETMKKFGINESDLVEILKID